MGIEAPATSGRVTGQTVALGMAGDAALEALAGGLSVIENEALLRIMKADTPETAGRNQARVDVAVGAELALVVALAAGALPAVRSGRMGR